MNGGDICYNRAEYNGSSPYTGHGGGVYVYCSGSSNSTFQMDGGNIYGNTAFGNDSCGGGVFLSVNSSGTSKGTLIKTAGTINGYFVDENGDMNPRSNRVENGSGTSNIPIHNHGHAVCQAYVNNSAFTMYKFRDSTAGEKIGMDSTEEGVAGGWENTTDLKTELDWLTTNAEDEAEYLLILKDDETLDPATLGYSSKTVKLTLCGGKADGTPAEITLSTNGSLFTVGAGVTLVLDENITLQGQASPATNDSPLVEITAGGELVMRNGSAITGNATTNTTGGGVCVNGGTFTMEGGDIHHNTGSISGGGVYV
jgi:hypothetical protein